MESKSVPWSNHEIQTFPSVVADQRIQTELDGATRNQKIYQENSERMAGFGRNRLMKQCREKLKKLKSDYRYIKDHNGRSGSNRQRWKWFDQMDAIYGHQPASNGRESGLDSAAALVDTFENAFLSTCGVFSASAEPASSPPSSSAPAAASPVPPRTSTPSTSTSSTQQRPVAALRQHEASGSIVWNSTLLSRGV
ncbi:zinc finger and SCAN domain-containing protein 29-like [Amphiprion ocellaris]|uniref:zinc finger and SCAN domain-containing protein 29-like n=1 Tax=Amphiprion ocellaris TaxID=80972 RepID=UPI002410D4BD|nr:zinc finger and SCAN domain-containing protein 29-like [Amphiprion ocellaris]